MNAPRRLLGATLTGLLAAFQLGVLITPAQAAASTVTVENESVTEPGAVGLTAMVFSLARSGDVTGPAVVDYAVGDGADTATAGRDYLKPDPGSVSFAAGETTAELRIDVLGDILNEGDEFFTVTFSSSNATIAGGTNGTVTGTILEDDDPAPQVSVSSAVVSEGDTGTRNASFAITLSAPSGRAVTVNYSTQDVTAKAGPDYSATSGSVTFNAGQLSKTVTVPVKGDTLDEDTETFSVVLSLPAGANATIGNGTGTGTINDDDPQPLASLGDVTVAEGAGNAVFTVTLSAASGRDVTVQATTADDIPASAKAGEDYTAVITTVTIPAGATTATFPVPVAQDTKDEGNETFRAQIVPTTNAGAGDVAAVGTITDDDVASFAISNVESAEGTVVPNDFIFTVTRSGVTGGESTIWWNTVDGNAKAPADYSAVPRLLVDGKLTFANNETVKTIKVDVSPDTLNEGDETFSVQLRDAAGGSVFATGTGKILDDDGGAAPKVSVADVSVAEGTGKATLTLTLTPASTAAVVVDIATQDGTAKAGRDFTAPAQGATVTIDAGQTTKTFDITVAKDSADEDNETFTVVLSSPQNAEISDGSAVVTITDDDNAPTVSVQSVSVGEGNNGSTVVDVKVTLSAASAKDITVDFTTAAGTATDGTDFSAAPSGTLFFKGDADEAEKTIAVSVAGDVADEADETVTLTLSNPSSTVTLGTFTGTLTITDDDATPTVSIGNATVDEPTSGNTVAAVFSVSLSAPSGRAVKVDFDSADGTAVRPADYARKSSINGGSPDPKLVIPAGAQGATIIVTVKGDGAVDAALETFTVTLSNPENATLGTAAGTGTIRDRDGPPVFSVEAAPVSEGVVGGVAHVTIRLFPSPGAPSTVTFATADGAAKAPGDYTALSGKTLSFAAGETLKTEDITIVNDLVDELDEAFSANLSSPSVGTASPATATVTIVDNDGPGITVSSPMVSEGGGPAKFNVGLTAASPQEVKVDYATSGGTATSPSDFTFATGTLTFAAGERNKTVEVALVNDAVDEDDETFSLSLSRPVNAVVAGSGRATIVDDDQAVITVAAAADSTSDPVVAEGDTGARTMTFTVKLDTSMLTGPARDVAVDFATADGTASAGADYLGASGRLTFAPGETVKTVVVPVFGDVRDEADETIVLRIPRATNGIVAKAATVGVITDDDGPGYALVASDGGLFAFGEADFVGSTGAMTLNQPIVGMAAHPSGRGYWLVAADGGVFAFGEAGFYGSAGGIKLTKPITAIAASPTGKGYWMAATDGGIFNYGDAGFFGSTGAIKLTKPVNGLAATPSGKGYWLVADDGGVFAFGDAKFFGSTGAITLNKPMVDMAATPTGGGYWLVASDGGVFAFGDAGYFGSTGDIVLNRPVVGMAATPSGQGYYLVADDGGVFKFGDGVFLGSTGNIKLNKPVVGMALL